MGITVVHGSPQSVWYPMKPGATIYVGGLVSLDESAPSEGVEQLPDAAGVANLTNLDIPLGVCIGTNRFDPLHSTTYNTDYITDPGATDAHDGASIDFRMVEGPWAKGDPIAMVRVALINQNTVLRAPIYNAAVGTAPSLLTVTTGDTDGLGCTTNAADFTGIATNLQTFYFRTGNNAGVYRITDSASSTVHAWDRATKTDVAVGDTGVMVPMRTHGTSTVMFDATTAAYIDCADAPVAAATNRWVINVIRLDLSTAGNEYVEFTFNGVHFNRFRNTATT